MHPLLRAHICKIEAYAKTQQIECIEDRIKYLGECIETKLSFNPLSEVPLLELAFELWLLRTLLMKRIENSN